eukprot:5363613-Alexandrium_andersonii.AAC.1
MDPSGQHDATLVGSITTATEKIKHAHVNLKAFIALQTQYAEKQGMGKGSKKKADGAKGECAEDGAAVVKLENTD